ncbi:MAG: PAS domain S-box protein [Vulcanimicrobiota bacterium]
MPASVLETFIEHCPAAVAMFDREMRYLKVSRRWCEEYQLGEREFIGQSHYELFPDLPQRWREVHQRCLAGAVEKQELDAFPGPDGAIVWLRWEVHPWRDEQEQIAGLLILSEVITQRVEAERKLKEREELLNFVGRAARIGGWELDVVTGRAWGTSEVARLYELDKPPTDLAGLLELHHGSSRLAVETAVRNALEHSQCAQLELETVSPRGVRRWLRFHCEPLEQDGRVVRLRCSLQDITPAVLANLRIDHYTRLYATLSQVNQNIVRYYDSREDLFEKIAEVMIEYGKFLGVALVWKPNGCSSSLIRWSSEAGAGVLMPEAELGQREICQSQDGSPVRSWASLPLFERGCCVGALVVCSGEECFFRTEEMRLLDETAGDISFALDRLVERHEHQMMEASLRRSEQTFRAIFELAAIGMGQADPATGRILMANRKLCEMTGYCQEELQQMSIAQLTHPADRLESRHGIEKVLSARGSGYQREKRYQHKDGREVWVNVHATMVCDDQGRPEISLGAAVDITARKQAEQVARELELQVRQAQKLEAVGQLAGGVAHDFNNILSSILMEADLALESELTAEAREHIERIVEDAGRAARLTRQLLVFSRKQVVQPKNLEVNRLLEGLAGLLGRVIREDIAFELELGHEPIWVYADPGMLEQVVTNLVVNARDAMPNGGRLSLQSERLMLDQADLPDKADAAPGAFVHLSVTDTGCGISPEHLDKIFEPFFTTKPAQEGTGLGLATVFGIVEQHGGWLRVDSTLGRGTTFHLYLPCAEAQVEAPVAAPASTPRGGAEKVLLVEDEEAVRRVISAILSRYGYQVTSAPDGAAARKLWLEHHHDFDLLVTDMMMPGGTSGRELAMQLQLDKPGLGVLLMSGYSREIAGQELFLKPWERFLQKPFQARELLEAVRGCLDPRRAGTGEHEPGGEPEAGERAPAS